MRLFYRCLYLAPWHLLDGVRSAMAMQACREINDVIQRGRLVFVTGLGPVRGELTVASRGPSFRSSELNSPSSCTRPRVQESSHNTINFDFFYFGLASRYEN